MNKSLLRWTAVVVVLADAIMLGWTLTRRAPSDELRITFLDVGQGDSAVIESPSGAVMLIDTGGVLEDGDNEGRRVVAPFLKHEGINRIDAILLTHPHADHIGGATTLIHQFEVKLLMDNGQETASPLVTQILEAAHDSHVAYEAATRGQELDLGDGVTADILAPTPAEIEGAPNNASIVARIRYGRTAFLMTGDAEAPEEEDILSTGADLACDVLKVGHHGSHTSTTAPFLAAAHPRIGVISVGAHNRYGHPSPEVVDRLEAAGVTVYRTDENGAVTCTDNGTAVHCAPMRH